MIKRKSEKTILFLFISLVLSLTLLAASSIAEDEELIKIKEYFPTEPGYYVKYNMSDNGSITLNNCKVEMVFQNAGKNTFLVTLTQIGTSGGYFRNSVMSGEEGSGRLCYSSGGSSGNQANLIFDCFGVPITLREGDIWAHLSNVYSISKIDDIKIGSTIYKDCLKIKINYPESELEFLSGTANVYLSKGIGIVKYEFKRENGTKFIAEIIESGNLPPRTISGRITLGGVKPAEGYIMALNNARYKVGIDAASADSQGKFSLQAFGHFLVLRCGPPTSKGFKLDYKRTRIYKLENITGDILDLELDVALLENL